MRTEESDSAGTEEVAMGDGMSFRSRRPPVSQAPAGLSGGEILHQLRSAAQAQPSSVVSMIQAVLQTVVVTATSEKVSSEKRRVVAVLVFMLEGSRWRRGRGDG